MKDATSPAEKKTLPPKACLFVGQIPRDAGEPAIRDHFHPYGPIASIKLLKDRAQRPFAFVQYEDEESADRALEAMADSAIQGRPIRVERARINCTLFVAKLPRDLSNSGLREMFESHGPIESVSIIKNHLTQESKGCGFVKFVDRNHAQAAFTEMKATRSHGLVIEWATSKNDPDAMGVDKCNIFVGGLNPQRIQEDELRARFASYGALESVTLVNRYPSGSAPDDAAEDAKDAESSGAAKRNAFAFLRYSETEASAAAIESENGVEWLDRRIRVQYCESQEMKNKRRAAKGGYPYLPAGPLGAPQGAMGGVYYPNGMVMMGGMAWYGPPMAYGAPGPVEMAAPYNYAGYTPYAAAGSWAPFTPSFVAPYGAQDDGYVAGLQGGEGQAAGANGDW